MVERIDTSCEIYLRLKRPTTIQKMSLSHVNEAFNFERLTDYAFVPFGTKRHTVLVMTDTGTSYREADLIKSRNAEGICRAIQYHRVLRHGVPAIFSGDDEFHCGPILRCLVTYYICFTPRLARRDNKTRIVEWKIQNMKIILRELHVESCNEDPGELVTRAAYYLFFREIMF